MNIRPLLALTGVLIALITLSACQSNSNNFSAEVATTDSLLTAVDAAAKRYEAVDAAKVKSALQTIKDDMVAMRMLSNEVLDSADAVLFSEYNSAKRLIKDFPKRNDRIIQELDRTRQQLQQFKAMLQSGATEDKDGNKITAEYVKENAAIEHRVASSLIEEIDITIDYATRGVRDYEALEPNVKARLAAWKSE